MRYLLKKIWLLSLFASSLVRVQGQEYSYAHYDTRDGLASSVVYHAATDKDGFMWFATETGLSRFDGTQFRTFTIRDGMPDNEIMKLKVDSKNRLWIMPFSNSICYYKQGKIYNATNDPFLKAVRLTSPVTTVAEDRHGNILLQEAHGVHLLKPDGKYIAFLQSSSELNSSVHVGLDKQRNFVIAGTKKNVDGLLLFGIVNDRVRITRETGGFTPNSPNSAILSPDIEILQNKQTLHISTKDTSFVLALPGHFISVSRLPGNILSLNAIDGAHMYNLKDGRIIDTFLKGRSVTTVVPDHEGNWWFCTQGQGIFRLVSSEFQNFDFSSGEKSSAIYSIVKYDSVLYFGSDKYTIISREAGNFRRNVIHASYTPGRITAMVKPDIHSMIVGADNGFFLYRNGIKQAEIPALSVKSIWMKGNELLVAGHMGTYYVRPSDLSMLDTIWRQRSTWAWKIHDTFYIGALNGLYRIDKNGTVDMGKHDSVFTRRISAMAEGDDGTLWIGTYGEGVIGLKHGKAHAVFSEKNGLSSNNCRALYVKGTDLWVGTERGLNKVSMSPQFRVTKFTVADGLTSDIINAIYVDQDTVYVGTAEGLTRFNEARISQQSSCLLRMTGIRAGTAIWAHDTANFILPNKNKQLRFEFAGISFKSGGDITYYFRLMGLNNEWQATRSSFLSYPSLPSGKYRLECYAVNKFGIKSNTLSIPFSVEKTIWEEWWFRILAGIILITAVWIFIVFRIRILRRREQSARKMEKRMAELEQMALKAQMNPHFIFNSLNSIQQYVLESDFTGVNNFITGFASLIRQTLDVSSKHTITLEEELNYISTYLRLEKMRLEDKFTYEINVRNDITASDYAIPPLILQPCLENSIRHGIRYRKDKDGKITINILKDDNYLICIIDDNGVGRKLAEQYKGTRHIEYQSKGMSLTASRIEMLTGNSVYKPSVDWEDITTDNGSIAGTRVIIRLPLEDIS